MPTNVVDHPIATVRLTTMRDAATSNGGFRSALEDLSTFVLYEALRGLNCAATDVETPLTKTRGLVVDRPPLLVPILRAGLGMLGPAQKLLPESDVGFIGLKRNEETLAPDPYITKLPDDLTGRGVLVLDPMLATGGSLEFACRMIADRGATDITAVCILAAPEGCDTMEKSGLGVTVWTAALDDSLNDVGFIVPGLGDAGDRQFGVQ